MNWCVMPYLGNLNQTYAAVCDVLAQTIADVRLFLINQGGEKLEGIDDPRVYHVAHVPILPSLAATWNLALRTVWDTGEDQALVVNNDVRVHPELYEALRITQAVTGGLLVSAVNVGEAWSEVQTRPILPLSVNFPESTGGPDFSCFLITKACHEQYPFDEGFAPAYCEDLDYHRRLMLAGHREKIFSVNLPFLHYASGTLKGMTEEQRMRHEAAISAGSRAHYVAKWGGGVNQERYTRPFDPTSDQDGVTTPELQHARHA